MDLSITNENICKISLRSNHRNDRKRRGQRSVNNEFINIFFFYYCPTVKPYMSIIFAFE